ncbi:MAG: hypothetical protein KGJ13_09165 [Patescibacteria group bacterium]|nr:hypothetical protein [Patescibacteria group bacterium]
MRDSTTQITERQQRYLEWCASYCKQVEQAIDKLTVLLTALDALTIKREEE